MAEKGRLKQNVYTDLHLCQFNRHELYSNIAKLIKKHKNEGANAS